MDTGTDKSIPDWLNPDKLIELIELLREAGYKIGISQHIAAQDLILFLIAQGQTLDNPERLRTLLGPIFCKSLIEQENFQYHFDNWLELVKQISRASYTTEKVNLEAQVALSPSKNIRTRTRLLQWILIFIALLTGTSLLLTYRNNTPLPTPTPTSTSSHLPAPKPTSTTKASSQNQDNQGNQKSPINWQIVLYFLLSFCFLIYVSSRLFWLWQANLFLQRSSTRVLPELQTISIPDLEQNLFPRHLFINIARAFRQRILSPSNTLNVEKTIDTFFQRGDWVEPVYRNYAVIPEYLFLVERTGYRDHQSKFVAEMIERLKNDGVYLETYFYDEDPRICFSSDEHNSPLKLHEIATKYRQHYLIVVSDTEKLFSSISGELEPWVNQLLDWKNRAILTPKPVENCGYEEFVLAQDFLILPATPTGLQVLSQKLQQGIATNYSPTAEIQFPLPESLRTRPLRWIERNPPPPEDIDAMWDSLKEYLGKDNLNWLGACAIFPQLHWNITVYLGNTLKTEAGHSVLEVASLTKLARLPWFRFGYIPDWLRIRLISALTHEQEHQIRTALQNLLIKAVQGSVGGLQLEVATQSYSFSSKLINPILHILSKQASEGSLLKDYVFLSFMTRPSVLGMRVSKEFNRLLQRQKRYNSSEKILVPNYRRQFLKWFAFGGVVLITVMYVIETLQTDSLNNFLWKRIEDIIHHVVYPSNLYGGKTGKLPLSGIILIKKFEGCFLKAYPDPMTGNLPITIGWGSTKKRDGSNWKLGERITQEEADELLITELETRVLPSLEKIPVWNELNANQRGALFSFAYGAYGDPNFYYNPKFQSMTTVLKNKQWDKIKETFLIYRNPGSNIEIGMRRRRQAEADLFLTPIGQ